MLVTFELMCIGPVLVEYRGIRQRRQSLNRRRIRRRHVVPESFFGRQSIEAQVALAGLRDASDLLRFLLTGGNSVKAGVIAGALRRIGRPELADEVVKAMKAAGYDTRESDSFEPAQAFGVLPQALSPIVARMQAMWRSMRNVVGENFPEAPGLPEDKGSYPDGNGRMARFVMHAMLASGGYPWAVIRVEDRDPYLPALDTLCRSTTARCAFRSCTTGHCVT